MAPSSSSSWPENGLHSRRHACERLILVLGDQLDPTYMRNLGVSQSDDLVVMLEVENESTHALSHVQRTSLFLSAMRHHALRLRDDEGYEVQYVAMDDRENTQSFGEEIERLAERFDASELRVIRPGEWRVQREIEDACERAGIELHIEEDPHFFSTIEQFEEWAEGRKQLTMEYFYREMRREHGILVDENGSPEGGEWNYDKQNRETFKERPEPPEPVSFSADKITQGVIEMVTKRLPDLPGTIDGFNWPVTRRQALLAVNRFIDERLEDFGRYQDAMWTGEHTLYHSLLSTSLNLKLVNPREVVDRALDAYRERGLPINSVEGFVRQLLGWREFIRGVYYQQGDGYPDRNELGHDGSLPEFYWTSETNMRCMKHALASVLDRSYGHHIARLMITGNFALISGIDPQEVNNWYLGMYADGVDWVTAPNTIGMALHADGGVVGTKPYAASGKYVQRMSNYCKGCGYDVKKRSGEDACPFNVFYWDFLNRHRKRFNGNNRMAMMLKNLERIDREELQQITVSAKSYREEFGIS